MATARTVRKAVTAARARAPERQTLRANFAVPSMPEPQSLRETAYETIKHRIITCVLKPGEYINEAYISNMLGIGRTPVHQAFDRLMLEGMVGVIPRKGVIVKPVSLDEIMQIVEVRLLNETYCVRLAAERAEKDEIHRMSNVLSRAADFMNERDAEQLMLHDREFHGLLARASKNAVLGEFLSKLHDRSLRFWFISLNTPGHHKSVQEQHEAILNAIKRHEPDSAVDAMRTHIESFRANIVRSL
jgi:GntR family transcriptional regulator, rspAB operon transcriptional repressor